MKDEKEMLLKYLQNKRDKLEKELREKSAEKRDMIRDAYKYSDGSPKKPTELEAKIMAFHLSNVQNTLYIIRIEIKKLKKRINKYNFWVNILELLHRK